MVSVGAIGVAGSWHHTLSAVSSLVHTFTCLSEREGHQRNGYTTVSCIIETQPCEEYRDGEHPHPK
jgi:hypothetical protein